MDQLSSFVWFRNKTHVCIFLSSLVHSSVYLAKLLFPELILPLPGNWIFFFPLYITSHHTCFDVLPHIACGCFTCSSAHLTQSGHVK